MGTPFMLMTLISVHRGVKRLNGILSTIFDVDPTIAQSTIVP
jgi:hypothetical protein